MIVRSDPASRTLVAAGGNHAPGRTSTKGDTDRGGVTEKAGTPGAGTVLSVSGTGSFTDADLTDTHTITAFFDAARSGHASALGSMTPVITTDSTGGVVGHLKWTYTVDARKVEFLAAGQTLTEVFNLASSDGHGGTLSDPVTITLTGTNDAPVLTYTKGDNDQGRVTEVAGTPAAGTVLRVSGTGTFTDADLTDTHTITAAFDAARSGHASALGAMTPVITTDSTGGVVGHLKWTYRVDARKVEVLAAGQTLTEVFNLVGSDGHGGTVSRLVTVTLTGTNDAPVLGFTQGDTDHGRVTEVAGMPAAGTVLSVSGTGTFTDVDLTDRHTITAAFDAGRSGHASALGAMTPVITKDSTGGAIGHLKWTYTVDARKVEVLAAGQTLTEVFTLVGSDGHGGTTSRPVTVTLTGTNDAPVLTYTKGDNDQGRLTEPAGTPAAGTVLSVSGTGTFTDADLTDTHTITAAFDAGRSGHASALGSMTPVITKDSAGGVTGRLKWTYTVDARKVAFLAAGQTYTEVFTLVGSDGHGGTLSHPITITLVGTGQAPRVTVALAHDTGAKATDGLTRDDSLTGTADANAVLRVAIDGKDVGRPVQVGADGTWTYDPTGLADGPHTVVASETASGATGSSSPLAFTLDTTAPAVAITTPAATTSQSSVTVKGTAGRADATAVVTVFDGATAAATTAVGSDGTWSATVPLASGRNVVHAEVTDLAGNIGRSPDVAFSRNASTPVVTAGLADDTGTSGDRVTSDAALAGTGDPNAIIHFTVDGTAIADTATVKPDGTWRYTPTALKDGAHTVVASETVGEVTGSASPLAFTLDTTAPKVGLTLAHDTGSSATDGVTSNPALSGTGDPSAVVHFTVDGTTIAATATAGPTGAWSYTPTGLADGRHTVVASERDLAGNTGSASLAFTLATGTTTPPPPAPVFTLATTDQAGPNQTRAGTVTLVGKTGANDKVTLSTGASTVADKTGAFRFADVVLAAGANDLTARATDAAGQSTSYEAVITRLAPAAGQNVVLTWDQAMLSAIQLAASDPEIASRVMAIESLAVYDAVSGVNGTPGYLVSMAAPAGASADAAAASAAHEVLTQLYPRQAATFDALLATTLSGLADGAAKTNGLAYGKALADKILALRVNDGWDKLVDDEGSTAVGQWRPTLPNDSPGEEPQWGSVTPWTLTTGDQFRAAAPPDLTSKAYADAVNKTLSLGASDSTTRTADQTQIAKFWADGTGSVTPAGHWNAIAATVAQAKGDSLAQDARLFAELNLALADSAIACFDTKYTYNTWRPITLADDAAAIGNAAITGDPGFVPLINTPPHPEYVSGHSTYSGAASTVLASVFGDSTAFSIGSTSLGGVTRSFTSFSQAAAEAGESRIYGGIHFEFSNQAGQEMGGDVGQWTLKAFDLSADTVAPKVTLDQTAGFATNKAVTLTGNALDNLSGVVQLQYKLDGGAATALTFAADGSFSLPLGLKLDGTADGAHTVQVIAADAAGNIAAPVSIGFTLDTEAPTVALTAASVQDGGTLAAGSLLAGTVTPESGVALKALSYTLDGGVVVPLAYDGTGAFSQALDLSQLGAGKHTLALTALDAAGNQTVDTLHLNLAALPPLTVTELTPMMGAGDVGVTYKPQITFSRAVDTATLTSSSFYATDSTGTKVDATIVPTQDGTGAYLFFKSPLPGASTITLHVDGSRIKAKADGALLDAAGTGVPGSVETETFTTVSTAAVPNTTISGIVLDPGADLTPMTPDDFKASPNGPSDFAHDTFKLPIAHVKVFILGHEDQAVYTDDKGAFTLTSVPTGDVKVVFDGRTAANAPSGLYFPTMTMDTTIRPGIVNTLMGSMGTADQQAYNVTNPAVYLPRVQSDILTTVSDTALTVVTAPQDATQGLTALQASKLSLTVAPGSLVDINGKPIADAKVGISPVAPQIVMDMLPPGVMQHTFDITIQAPDGAAFTTPATLTLPNVFNAAPGTKLNILSFDHDTGRLVIDGTGTVSADGLQVVTDPGSGVTKPGWHGMTPPGSEAQSDPGDPPCKLGEVAIDAGLSAVKNFLKALASQSKGIAKDIEEVGSNVVDLVGRIKDVQTALDALDKAKASGDIKGTILPLANILDASCAGVADIVSSITALIAKVNGELSLLVAASSAALSFANDVCKSAIENDCLSGPVAAAICDAINFASYTLKYLQDTAKAAAGELPKQAVDTLCDTIGLIVTSAVDASGAVNTFGSNMAQRTSVDASPAMSLASLIDVAQVEASNTEAGVITLQSATTLLAGKALPKADELAKPVADLYNVTVGAPAGAFYKIISSGNVLRGRAEESGRVDVFLPPDSPFTISLYDAKAGYVAKYTGTTSASGAPTSLPAFHFGPDTSTSLIDGLTAAEADIVGVDPSKADNFIPGITDLAVLQSGLVGKLTSGALTGVSATLELNGEAQSIALVGSMGFADMVTAYVATGSYGLAIVDASNPLSPKVLSQLRLSGGMATDAAVDGHLDLAAVATGTGGLQIVDVGDPTTPTLVQVINVDATQVRTLDGIVYCDNGPELDVFDLSTGALIQAMSLSGATVTGMTLAGTSLYTLDTSGKLSVFDASGGELVLKGSADVAVGGHKIFVADGVAYIAASDGFNGGYATIDVSDPVRPVLIEGVDSVSLAGNAVALNGSGLGVLVGSPGPAGTGAIDVVNASDAGKTDRFVTRFDVPGAPNDVAIGGGVAFVADGSNGLQVVNYKSFDTLGVAPTVTVTAGPADVDLNTAGTQVVEGGRIALKTKISDDVQVRNVELLVNGRVATNQVSYPWQLSALLPTIAANGSTAVTLQVEAIDTGGNTTITDPITLQLVRDTIPPKLVRQTVEDGEVIGQVTRTINFAFSEPLDSATVSTSTFALSGPDGKLVTPSAVLLRGDDRIVQLTYPTLALGAYKLLIDASGVADRAGNALGKSPIATDFEVQPFSEEWIAAGGGSWQDGANWSRGVPPDTSDSVLLTLPTGTKALYEGYFVNSEIARLTESGGGAIELTEGTLRVREAVAIAGTLAVDGDDSGYGTFINDDKATVATLVIGGGDFLSQPMGALGGSGDMTVTSALDWSGGTMSGSGKTIVAQSATATLTLDRGSNATLGRGLDIAGSGTLTGGSLVLGLYDSTSRSYAAGALTIAATGSLIVDDTATIYSPSGSLTNKGRLIKTGSNATEVDAVLTNTGRLDVMAGALQLGGGGVNSGAIDIAAGATLDIFAGGFGATTFTFAKGTALTGLGTLSIGYGTFELETTLTISNLAVNGTLAGSGDVTLRGSLNWSYGTMLGPGKTIVAPGAVFKLGSPYDSSGQDLGRELDLDGVGTLTSAGFGSEGPDEGDLRLGVLDKGTGVFNKGTLAIGETGRLTLDGKADILQSASGSGVVSNAGTIIKTGADTNIFDAAFTNDGTLAVKEGKLELRQAVSNLGTIDVGAASTLQVDAALTGSGSVDVHGAGSLVELRGAASDTFVFTDTAVATLKLDQSSKFKGVISGFVPNSILELADVIGGSASLSYTQQQDSGVLKVSDGSNQAQITFAGQHVQADFALSADPSGGTFIKLHA